MKRFFLLIVLVLAACSPSESAIQTAIAQTQSSWTPIPSQTAAIVIQTKIVTPTFTSTPIPTATKPETPTPDPNLAITQTASKYILLTNLKRDGFYLVNQDIAPGVWRSGGNSNDCYWEITSETGNIINNHFGMAGGTMFIPSDAFQVQMQGCGLWTFLKP